jgi:hypothetical protein
MQAADAGHAIARLLELANLGPGADSGALQEAQAVLYRMGGAGEATGYLAERITAARASFETWLGNGKSGSDPQALRAVLLHDIEKLRKAIARGVAGQD